MIEITGNKYYKLTVVKYIKNGIWECICECGQITRRCGTALRKHRVKSCGCLQRQWRKTGFSGRTLLEAGISNLNYLYFQYKSRAAKIGKKFELSKDEFKLLTSSVCYYCGCVPSQICLSKKTVRSLPYIYNGIDRLDSNLGYTKLNTVPACFRCNQAKRQLTETEFYTWIIRIFNHSSSW